MECESWLLPRPVLGPASALPLLLSLPRAASTLPLPPSLPCPYPLNAPRTSASPVDSWYGREPSGPS